MIPEFDVLVEDDRGDAADALLRAYGGALASLRHAPIVYANFVSSIDGVVALTDDPVTNSSDISLKSSPDRFVMALLRANADCVMVGAATLRHAARHQWTAAGVASEYAAELADLRRRQTGAAMPAPLVIVSASGDVPVQHPALAEPATDVLILTTQRGQDALPALPSDRVRVAAIGAGATLAPEALIAAVRDILGAQAILCEGGPTLLGSLFGADQVNELFLTVAPHVVGRSEAAARPGLVAGMAFAAGATPRAALRSVRRHGDHLFLRYRFAPRDQ